MQHTTSLKSSLTAAAALLLLGATAAASIAADKPKPPQGSLVGHGGPVKAVAVSPDGTRALSGSFDYSMIHWNIEPAGPHDVQRTKAATPGAKSAEDAQADANGKPAANAATAPLSPASPDTPPAPAASPAADVIARIDAMEGAVNAVAFAKPADVEPSLLAAGDDGSLWQFSARDGSLIKRFEGHTAKVVGLSVSPDGHFAVTASWDRTARLWNLKSGAAGPVLEGHQGPVNAAVFSADGATVFTASYDGALHRYRAEDGTFERPIYKHGWGLNVLVRLNGEDDLLFGSLDGSVGIVDGVDGELTKSLASHDKPVLALAVNAGHNVIASSGGDGRIRVWENDADGFSGAWGLKEEFENPYGPIWAMAFSGDAGALYYGGLDDVVHRWVVTPRQPFEVVESSYPRRFQISGNPDDPVAVGEIQFARKCSVCHTLNPDGANRAGPTLHNIFGRRIATLPGYNYSEPLKKLDIVWTEETVSKLFELGPENFTPGSKMPLQKMTDDEERDALIAFLKVATTSGPDADQSGDGAGKKNRQRTDSDAAKPTGGKNP